MAEEKAKPEAYVKKETMFWVAAVALVAGFFMGMALTVYKSRSRLPVPLAPPKSQPEPSQAAPKAGDQALSVETSARILKLEQQTAQHPADAEAWTQLGNLYFDSDNFEKSIEAYRKALAIKPDNADVWTDLGVMYRRSGQPAEAVKAFDRAIAINPGHEASRFNKGVVLMHDLNDAEGAVRAWEELVTVNPAAKSSNGQLVSDLLQLIQSRGKP